MGMLSIAVIILIGTQGELILSSSQDIFCNADMPVSPDEDRIVFRLTIFVSVGTSVTK